MSLKYNSPINGTPSSIDTGTGRQINTEMWHRKALIEAAKETVFGQLADITSMPKHYGKKITKYHYIPLLDVRNQNDQGLDANGAVMANGNLWGSSKDVGKIQKRIPAIGENGGTANRVGFSRQLISAEINRVGFYTSFTKESLDFDTDSELYGHISREMIMGAHEITEDMLQIDLLNGAGVVRLAGEAMTVRELTGEGDVISEVTYDDLQRLSLDLDDNRCPKKTKVITGSQMTNTVTVNAARFMYVGSELVPTLTRMKDHHGAAAFIGVEHYAYSGVDGINTINGEIGKIGDFRIIQVAEMLRWEGAGAAVTDNQGYKETDGFYDVAPMLVVGDEAFTTVGFQSGGKGDKFKIKYSMPEDNNAYSVHADPYGQTGFISIMWWYGTLISRPERIALIKTVVRE